MASEVQGVGVASLKVDWQNPHSSFCGKRVVVVPAVVATVVPCEVVVACVVVAVYRKKVAYY